jgi:hypothetical protein
VLTHTYIRCNMVEIREAEVLYGEKSMDPSATSVHHSSSTSHKGSLYVMRVC